MPDRIYWDTNCFLGWFMQEPLKIGPLKAILEQADRGELVIATSTLTIVECAGLPTTPPTSGAQSEK